MLESAIKSISSSGKSRAASSKGAEVDEIFDQAVDAARKFATQVAAGEAGSLFGAAGDQVSDGLGLRQIELAVEKGAFTEFAGAGQARPQCHQPA